MSAGRVDLDITGGVAVLTLDRPERRNAMNDVMWQALRDTVLEAAHASPRALVLRGTGHFCSGMDLKPDHGMTARAAQAIFERDHDAATALIRDLKAFIAPLLDFPAPTIAAIEGVAVGGGFEIALHCDLRVAARDARIALPEARVGMVPDLGGTTLLTRLVGPGRAAMVIATGREYTGDEAFALGMVEQVCEPGRALEVARGLARDIAAGGPKAVALALGAIRQMTDPWRQAAFELETRAGAAALTSGEAQEGVVAFVEKRPARW